ncbi:MAG: hypothetical protein LBO75_00140 [Bifidobacteriaceae bacterium]|jgi:hypothetical protein|nr:hypothetical protein [Bifidobacteriaceae bacterium]
MRFRTAALVAALALVLTACGDSKNQGENAKPHPDKGTVPAVLLPQPKESDEPPEGLDEVLKTQGKPDDGWLSAPWAQAAKDQKKSTDLAIIYVDGDTKCYGHAGFTLDESSSKVTVGSYVKKVEGAKDCPKNPAGAFKWGTVKLAEPLGDRELVHEGIDQQYSDFTWDKYVQQKAKPEAPASTTAPAADSASASASTAASPAEE